MVSFLDLDGRCHSGLFRVSWGSSLLLHWLLHWLLHGLLHGLLHHHHWRLLDHGHRRLHHNDSTVDRRYVFLGGYQLEYGGQDSENAGDHGKVSTVPDYNAAIGFVGRVQLIPATNLGHAQNESNQGEERGNGEDDSCGDGHALLLRAAAGDERHDDGNGLQERGKPKETSSRAPHSLAVRIRNADDPTADREESTVVPPDSIRFLGLPPVRSGHATDQQDPLHSGAQDGPDLPAVAVALAAAS